VIIVKRDKIAKSGHKIIAVVGNRQGWGLLDVMEKINQTKIISKEDMIVSGGAIGVDTYAQVYAKKKGIPIIIIYPDMEQPSPERYFTRNRKIAELSDSLLVFNKKGAKGGTWNTILCAKRMGKKVKVFTV
jgi:predicted Rossmann fold nucleotide-binding protein DprA/Smf involved in DNA uptake